MGGSFRWEAGHPFFVQSRIHFGVHRLSQLIFDTAGLNLRHLKYRCRISANRQLRRESTSRPQTHLQAKHRSKRLVHLMSHFQTAIELGRGRVVASSCQ